MRVISGSRRGRPLQAVPGKSTRPTTDKVKEAIFSMIGQTNLDGGWGLDLYAGTGGLGIEALSRGLEQVIFVDQNKKAFEIIKQNLTSLDLLDQSEVYKNEASRALKAILKRDLRFSLVFLDPPYAEQKIASQLAILDEYNLIVSGGMIIVETGTGEELPARVGSLFLEKNQVYGDTEIRIYQQKEED
jgi:16S rRNA (guanine966-N2)-methyltransferase